MAESIDFNSVEFRIKEMELYDSLPKELRDVLKEYPVKIFRVKSDNKVRIFSSEEEIGKGALVALTEACEKVSKTHKGSPT